MDCVLSPGGRDGSEQSNQMNPTYFNAETQRRKDAEDFYLNFPER